MYYIEYKSKELLSHFFGVVTWMSLTTFMLVAKNAIGVNYIPIFEFMIFVSGIIGIKIAYGKFLDYTKMKFLNISIETIFLLVLYVVLISNNLRMAGLVVYSVIIINAISNRLERVSARDLEDYKINKAGKRLLRKIRKKEELIFSIGGALGSGIALVCLTYFKIDLILFTKMMLILNVVQNIWDYYIWYKYLYRG